MHFRWQPDNPAGSVFRHLFSYANRHTFQVNAMICRGYTHGRAYACSERRGHEVGWRKAFALALIRWSVGGNYGLRRAVRRVAVQIAAVLDGNFNHGS